MSGVLCGNIVGHCPCYEWGVVGRGGETAFRGRFGAVSKVFWCRQKGVLVPAIHCFGAGSFGGGRELDNSDKGQGVFCAVGFGTGWLVGGFCWLVTEIFLVS